MEYVDLIAKIIAAERHARELAADAKAREAAMDAETSGAAAALRDAYLARAHRHLDDVARTEHELSAESFAAQNARHEAAMADLEARYLQNHAQWAQTLFARLVGQAP